MNWMVIFLIVLLVSTVVVAVLSISTVEAETQKKTCEDWTYITDPRTGGKDWYNACANVK